MKRISLYLQCFALILLMCSASLRSWGTGEPGTQLLQSAGSCSSFNLTGESDSGSSSDEAASLTGAPIDIPAPVAKNDDGIDPQSVHFEANSAGRIGQARRALARAQATSSSSNTVGTLYAETINSIERVVGVVLNGNFVDFLIATNGAVELPIKNSWVGESIALVVLSETSNSENIESVSRPVIVTFSEDEHFNTVIASVSITNVDSNTSNNPTNIRNSEITFTSNNRVAFITSDPSVGTIDLDYGFNNTLTSDLLEPLDDLTLIGDALYGTYATLLNTVSVATDGTLQTEDSADFPEQRTICGSPNGRYLASNATNGASQDLVILDLITFARFIAALPAPQPDMAELSCAWRSNTEIFVAKKSAAGNYGIDLYDVTNLLNDTDPLITPTSVISPSASPLRNPVVDPSTRNGTTNIAFECDVGNGNIDVCLSNVNGSSVTAVHEEGDASHIRYLPDGSGIVYELDYSSSASDLEGHALVYLNPESQETTYLTRGLKPAVAIDNSSIVSYLTVVNGTLQIGLLNLDFAL